MEKAFLVTENTDLNKILSENNFDRYYFGDAYCEHNLMYFLNNTHFLDTIKKIRKPLTLTTPIISEKNLMKLDEFLSKQNIIDEIVINDYGVLNLVLRKYKHIKIIWGNFLAGQNKDPFLKVFKDKEIHKKITIDNSYYELFLKENGIGLIELYNVFQGIDISIPYNFSLYYPYVVYSINRYCPTKLVYDKKNYLTIVEDCDGCMGKNPHDLNMKLKMKTEASNNYLRGNKQFYENNEMIESTLIKRIIYNYDLKG